MGIGNARGKLRGQDLRDSGVVLKATIFWFAGSEAKAVPNLSVTEDAESVRVDIRHDTIALFECFDARANLVYFTSHIGTQDVGKLLDKVARVLDFPIDRIDGNGMVLDDKLFRAWLWDISLVDLKRLALLFLDPCC